MTRAGEKPDKTCNAPVAQNSTVQFRRAVAHFEALNELANNKFSESQGKIGVRRQRRRRHRRLRRYGGGVTGGHNPTLLNSCRDLA